MEGGGLQVCLRKVKEPTGRVGVGMQPETCTPEEGGGGCGQLRVCSHGAHCVKDQKAVGVVSRASWDPGTGSPSSLPPCV